MATTTEPTSLERLTFLENKRIITATELEELNSLSAKKPFIVENLLQDESVNIIVGDSGLGKSPLMYQLALAVANGTPFCTLKTEQRKVLMIDVENSIGQADEMVRSLCSFTGALRTDNFLRLNARFPNTMPEWGELFSAFKDTVIIIDSMRACWPEAPEKNDIAARLMGSLKSLTRSNRLSFNLIHHIRKPGTGENAPPSLRDSSLIDWLNQASGARALINQSDCRIGVARDGEDRLLMKSKIRVSDEFEWILVREYDNAGSPAGYKILSGLDAIGKMRDDFLKLPNQFRFADARTITGRKGGALVHFLQRCITAGILHRIGDDGGYEKT